MTKQKSVTDQEGLDRAYASPIGLFSQGNTLYIAGTTNRSHVAEWWKIAANKVRDASIYGIVMKYLRHRHRINRLVGHSYGGSVALELQRQSPKYAAITYGAPVLDPIPRNPYHQPERYCNIFDPVCAADFAASKQFYFSPSSPNPHSYINTSIQKNRKI